MTHARTTAAVIRDASGDGARILQAADRPEQAGKPSETLASLTEAAAATELPPADLCLQIARRHAELEAFDEAFSWIARVVDSSDSFLDWQAAASLLGKVSIRARPQARRSCRVAITGSSTTSQLAALLPLAALRFGVDAQVQEGLYGQYQQDLISPNSALYGFEPEAVVIAADETALQLPSTSGMPEADVAAEAQRWRSLWDNVAARTSAHIVQHNFALRPEAPLGHLSSRMAASRYAMVQELNRQLAMSANDGVSIVDCDRLASNFGRDQWFDDRYWFRSKQAVALAALPLLARHTAAVLAARLGLSRKCLVLDLDNTLWGGVVGDEGVEGIRLGADATGEAFVAFQEYVLELKERGVVLAVASKNNDADAREVFERHPDMRIRLNDIAVFAVNWDDKATSLRRIADTLGIGLNALVFADDNPAERQIVRRLLPEVDVIRLPNEPAGYRRALSDYLGFESVAVTEEDRQRTDQYRARAASAELRSSTTDIESFYRDLNMQAVVAPFDATHLPRIAQLVGKTNQFNLTTRRHSHGALEAMMSDDSCVAFYLKLSDRLADHGLVSVLIGFVDGEVLDIDTFLMSCRVIGRTVEATMLSHLCDEASRRGCSVLRGTYAATPKNAVVRDLYAGFGFRKVDETGEATQWQYDLRSSGSISNDFISKV
jgi:FkbH-like protein